MWQAAVVPGLLAQPCLGIKVGCTALLPTFQGVPLRLPQELRCHCSIKTSKECLPINMYAISYRYIMTW